MKKSQKVTCQVACILRSLCQTGIPRQFLGETYEHFPIKPNISVVDVIDIYIHSKFPYVTLQLPASSQQRSQDIPTHSHSFSSPLITAHLLTFKNILKMAGAPFIVSDLRDSIDFDKQSALVVIWDAIQWSKDKSGK